MPDRATACQASTAQVPDLGPSQPQDGVLSLLRGGEDAAGVGGEEDSQHQSGQAEEDEHRPAHRRVGPGDLEGVGDVVDEVALVRCDALDGARDGGRLRESQRGLGVEPRPVDEQVDLGLRQALHRPALRRHAAWKAGTIRPSNVARSTMTECGT